MKKSDYISKSLLSAAGVLVYTAAVAWLMFNAHRFFGKPDNFLMPLFVLLLLVISASITGLLVLGRPIHLYLNEQKREAFILLFTTLGWLILFALVIVISLLF